MEDQKMNHMFYPSVYPQVVLDFIEFTANKEY